MTKIGDPIYYTNVTLYDVQREVVAIAPIDILPDDVILMELSPAIKITEIVRDGRTVWKAGMVANDNRS